MAEKKKPKKTLFQVVRKGAFGGSAYMPEDSIPQKRVVPGKTSRKKPKHRIKARVRQTAYLSGIGMVPTICQTINKVQKTQN